MPRITREQSKALTREKLLFAASKVFSHEGLGGATIDRIAEEAGFSKGAFYSNFESKEDIFLQLVETVCGRDASKLEAALIDLYDPEEIVLSVMTWADAHNHDPDMRPLVLDLVRHARQSAALRKRHTEIFSKQWKMIGTLLLRLFPSGAAPATPLELGALVMELTYGNALQLHRKPTAGDLIAITLRGLVKASALK